MVITEGIYVVTQAADMIWVGKLGSASIAGVGVSAIILMVVLSMLLGVITGARAMVARFIGAGDPESANRVTGQAFVIVIIYGALIGVLGAFLTEPVLSLLGVEAEEEDEEQGPRAPRRTRGTCRRLRRVHVQVLAVVGMGMGVDRAVGVGVDMGMGPAA